MVKTKRLFHLSLSSIAQPATVVEVLCVLLGKCTKLHNKHFGYCLIPYHISLSPQAFCFLKCSWLARKICQMLVLAKINTLLAKTIIYPYYNNSTHIMVSILLIYTLLFPTVKQIIGQLNNISIFDKSLLQTPKDNIHLML